MFIFHYYQFIYVLSQNQPDQITRSTPIDNIYRLFCLPFSLHYFQRQDTALPFQFSWGTCFWVHMYYESNNKCWEHPPVYLSYVHNQLDFLHTVVLWLSARMQSLCNRSKFNLSIFLLLIFLYYLKKIEFSLSVRLSCNTELRTRHDSMGEY